MQAIEVPEYGDADVMTVVERDRPEPGPGELRIEIAAAGINFADVMQRRGAYPGGPEPPFVPGFEAAGVVDAVGEGVGREEGDRVVAMLRGAGYAEYALAPAETTLNVPEGMTLAEAAGIPVQFFTAHNCLFGWGELEADERVLITAAAGGVGTAAVQLADRAGATVLGTASTEGKRELAAGLGCDHTIDYVDDDLAEAVAEITDGEGVHLALDGVGGETTTGCLDALTQFGRLITYGAASGEPGRLETTDLLFGNVTVRGYHLGRAMTAAPERVFGALGDIQGGLADGDLEVVLGDRFRLEDAVAAHDYIESRASSGKVVLEP